MFAAMSLSLVAVAQADAATRVMPLGDSITHGWNVEGGYRIALEDRLIAAGLDVDFVGSQSNGPSELADRQHEGYPGARIHRISERIDPLLASQQPEVVLLLIGTNDILRSHLLATAPQRLSSLIDQIAAGAPAASILVASLPTLETPNGDSRVRAYNSAIPGVVADQVARGHRVSFVDMYPALGRSDIADRIHPNRVGYDKMAAVWESSLRATLRPVSAVAPVTAPTDQPSVESTPQRSVEPGPQPSSPAPTAPASEPQVVQPPVASPAPAGAPARRVVLVARQSIRMDRRGRLRVRVRCPSANPSPCRGSVRLERAGRRTARLATGRFVVRAGRASGVRLRLTGERRRSVSRRASTRVVVRTRVRDSNGALHVTRTPGTLRAGSAR